MTRLIESHRRSFSVIILFASLCVLGCGSDGKLKVYPVSGVVKYNGNPLKGVDIAFHPKDAKNNSGFPPNGKTDADGKFTLSTYLPNDGAPAGDYDVAIAFSVEVAGDDDGSDQTRKIISQVPVIYHKKETTPFKVTIEPKDNVLQPFEMKGPALKTR
jgi:hypothetical protein